MCFSAEASFTASAVLLTLGAASLYKARHTSLKWLAFTPILFAIQQFSEGLLWLYLPAPPESSPISLAALYIYVGFAYLFWTIWIPFSLMMAEKEFVRKLAIFICLLAGVALSSYFVGYSQGGESDIHIVGGSIQYAYNGQPWKNYYGTIVLLACLLSSLRLMKVFSLFVLASFLISDYFYTDVFISVWCFFAAVISAFLYWTIKKNVEES